MTIHEVLQLGHPVLRTVAEAVPHDEISSPTVQTLCEDLVQTMRHKNGAGLAAPQIGVQFRVAVLEVNNNPRYPYKPKIPLTIAINPILTPINEETFENFEGCLSVPGLRGIVKRYRNLHVQYTDPLGVVHEQEVTGLTAGTWQHECDHLDGLLFVDRLVSTASLTTWDNFKAFYETDFVESISGL
ncbi:MAG: peptide deformylase [Myxococcota bacterium]